MIKYLAGYRYQLVEPYEITLPLDVHLPINTQFIKLDLLGNLTIEAGYAWDGPSGPTIDTKNFMRGSLVHDALYQLMRDGYLNVYANKELADKILQTLCLEDGMSMLRAWWVYQGVKHFGLASASVKRTPVTAP